jgi:hypothetical protein
MPVTTRPAPHGANAWKSKRPSNSPASHPAELLKTASDSNYASMKSMRQSSFDSMRIDSNIYGSANGFLEGAYRAYTNHNHLVIRPEDVWLSIIIQLNFYINANAEEVRDMFVRHDGKKPLVLFDPTATYETADFTKLILQFKNLLGKAVIDPKLKSWITPSFSTTTECDEVVAAAVFMSSMQKYFDYIMMLGCGLPSVTLLGERSDWEDIMKRLQKLPDFGEQPKQWAGLLRPVISRFINTFDAPDSQETKDFWQTIAHHTGGGSMPAYLSGWITAFCFWDKEGRCMYNSDRLKTGNEAYGAPDKLLELDGVKFHHVSDITVGYTSVPILFQDVSTGLEYGLLLVAGSVGVKATSSQKNPEPKEGVMSGRAKPVLERFQPALSTKERPVLDTVQPVSGWWIFEKQEPTRRILSDQII